MGSIAVGEDPINGGEVEEEVVGWVADAEGVRLALQGLSKGDR